MSEEEARDWLRSRYGDAGVEQLGRFVALVRAEAEQQNLISPSTKDRVWARHVADSAQLLTLANDTPGTWLDIGTGAGFPGMVVAVLRHEPICLVEPRARRARFLAEVAASLALDHVSVIQRKVKQVIIPAVVISARAVSGLADLFGSAVQCSRPDTLWLLPKGQSAEAEVHGARMAWRGVFHVEQSITDSRSSIVVARHVQRR